MSFSLFELGGKDLEEVESWTWREFQLKSIGYRRTQLKEWEKVRMICFHSMASNGALKKGTNLEKFMPLEPKKHQVNDYMKQALENAQNNYLKQVNGSRT